MMGELDVLPPTGPSFFNLRARQTELEGATITAKLRKPRLLAVRVIRVAGRRLVTVGVARLGHHPAGSSQFHWNLRVGRRLLAPGTYAITLHAITEGSLLSMPAGPGARTLIVLRNGKIRVRSGSPIQAPHVNVDFALPTAWAANPLYCHLLAAAATPQAAASASAPGWLTW
jgi:hypothetical protein